MSNEFALKICQFYTLCTRFSDNFPFALYVFRHSEDKISEDYTMLSQVREITKIAPINRIWKLSNVNFFHKTSKFRTSLQSAIQLYYFVVKASNDFGVMRNVKNSSEELRCDLRKHWCLQTTVCKIFWKN